MLISEETIARVRDANDIVEVVAEYVPNMKRAGKDFKALCPFHQEKTPSFMVSPAKGIFYCFGCGAGGDAFKFVMEMDRCSYPEAVRKLAERKGILVRQDVSSETYSKDQEQRKVLLEVVRRAAQYYHKVLLESPEAQVAREYLANKRKLTPETLAKFQIGWAPISGQALLKTALKAGFKAEDLLKAGLAAKSQRDGRLRDWFRGRILFPIHDSKGNLVAFGGRVLDGQTKPGQDPPPKYINSGDTEIFQKGRTLYGFYYGSRMIREKKEVLILEGYMDVIGCHQAGIENAVAPLGTALTGDQGQLMKRYVEQVTLLFDADKAGDSAAARGSEMLLEYGFLPTVARLPEGVDADDYLQTHSPDDFWSLISHRKNVVEFRLDWLLEKNKGAPDALKKTLVSQQVMPLVLKIENEVLRREMLRTVASRLGIREDALDAEFKKARAALSGKQAWKNQPAAPQPASATAETSLARLRQKLEEELVCLAVRHPELRSRVLEEAEKTAMFTSPKAVSCHAALKAHQDIRQAGDLTEHLEPETAQWLNRLLMNQIENGRPDEILSSLLKRLDDFLKKEKMRNLEPAFIEELNKGEDTTSAEEYQRIAQTAKGTLK